MSNKVNKLLLKGKDSYTMCELKNVNLENDFLNNTAQKLKDGTDILEFDGRYLSDKDFLSTAKKLRDLCGVFGALLIIRGRIDISKLSGADGVVLDNTSIGISEALELTENHILLGCHAKDGVLPTENELEKCDFIITNMPITRDIKTFQPK